jgi:hypothetical protein
MTTTKIAALLVIIGQLTIPIASAPDILEVGQ